MASFKVQETRNQITVEVSLQEAPAGLRVKNKRSVTKLDVMKHLGKLGIAIGKCTKEMTLSNFGKSPVLNGTFTFEVPGAVNVATKNEEVKNEEVKNEEVKNEETTQEEEKQDLPLAKEVTKVSRRSRRKRAKSEEATS
jgi:hypothetical protein